MNENNDPLDIRGAFGGNANPQPKPVAIPNTNFTTPKQATDIAAMNKPFGSKGEPAAPAEPTKQTHIRIVDSSKQEMKNYPDRSRLADQTIDEYQDYDGVTVITTTDEDWWCEDNFTLIYDPKQVVSDVSWFLRHNKYEFFGYNTISLCLYNVGYQQYAADSKELKQLMQMKNTIDEAIKMNKVDIIKSRYTGTDGDTCDVYTHNPHYKELRNLSTRNDAIKQSIVDLVQEYPNINKSMLFDKLKPYIGGIKKTTYYEMIDEMEADGILQHYIGLNNKHHLSLAE